MNIEELVEDQPEQYFKVEESASLAAAKPPEEPVDPSGISPKEAQELSRAFSREVQSNVFTGILSLISKFLPDYVKLDVPVAVDRLANSDYLSKYFEYRFGYVTGFLPEEIKAGIVTASYIAANTEFQPKEPEEVKGQPAIPDELEII